MRNDLLPGFDLLQWQLSAADRLLRLALSDPGGPTEALLIPQRLVGTESVCGGLEFRIPCVAGDAHLALKAFVGRPAEIRIVTDRRELRRICGIVTAASAGQSDEGLATYELVVRDALAVMEQRSNTRVFRNMSELDIVELLVSEWRQTSAVLAESFDLSLAPELAKDRPPRREFILQLNESDAAFIRRLLQRRGIAWHFRSGLPGREAAPADRSHIAHTMVLFDDAGDLPQNAAGSVRFHRDAVTEERDAVTGWSAVRTLQRGRLAVHSWDYKAPSSSEAVENLTRNTVDQGRYGRELAAGLDDYRLLSPHTGASPDDLQQLGKLMMEHYEYESKCFHGEGGVRALAVGEWIDFAGHPDIDLHPEKERQFVITAQRIAARNNLPVEVSERVERLFNRNGWDAGEYAVFADPLLAQTGYRSKFTCVRRGIPIVPPPPAVPRPGLMSAIVVGPPGEKVWCDELGRVKVRLPGARSDAESAWVRVMSSWAGDAGTRTLPQIGTEVMLDFAGGDPDKPVIVGQLFNSAAPPSAFHHEAALPYTRFQSGMRSCEVGGVRGNQLRLDDTPDQISAQLASDHAGTECNLGYLTEARCEGGGRARGEGAELRTEESIALRAARGILLSAQKMLGSGAAKGPQLAREDLLGLLRDCGELCSALGASAVENNGFAADTSAQQELFGRIERWEDGSNTAPQAAERIEPIVAVTAKAGLGFASGASIVSYAAKSIDTAAQQHLQLTAGQCVSVNAGKGVGLFAQGGGFKAIAHQGKLLLQSQGDDTDIDSAKDLKLTAENGTATIAARIILLVAEDGSFLKLGDGPPVMGSKQDLQFHAPDYVFEGPRTMSARYPGFGKDGADQRFGLRYAAGMADADGQRPPGGAVEGARMDVALGDGSSPARMTSDADGLADLLAREAMHIAEVSLLRGGDR